MPEVSKRWMIDSLARNWTVPTNALPPVTIVDGTATPTAIALTAVTPAPTASGGTGGTATPTAIDLTVTAPAPTTTGGGTATPTAIALTVVTSAPTVTGTAETTPAAIALAAVTAAPTAGGSSNTTPTAVALAATTPDPTVTGGGGATPAAIARTVVVPAPTAVGGDHGYAKPKTIGLGWYDAWTNVPTTVSANLNVQRGQSFTGDGSTVQEISFYVGQQAGTATAGTVVVAIYAHSGTFGTSSIATGSALATSEPVDATTLPHPSTALLVGRPVPFTFLGANQIVLANGTNYVAMVVLTGVTGDTLKFSQASGSPTGNGVANLPPSSVAQAGTDYALTVTGSDAAHAATLVPAPTVTGTAVASPAAIALVAVTPDPSASGGSSPDGAATPTAITLTVVTDAPTTTGGSNTTPAAIALLAVTPAPTASGDGVTTPAAVALTVVVPAPTITGTAETTPAAIAITVVTTTPTASGDARAPPAAIDLAAVTPAPTTTGGGTTSPAAIARTAVTPAPTITGTANTTPAAIVLAATTPAPTAQGGVAPPIFQAQSVASNALATSLTCQPVIPTHAINDILVCHAVNYAPNTAGDLADMTIAAGAQTWTAMGTTAKFGTTPNIDGTIQQWWRRAESSAETDPTVTRTGDTGADTGFQARVYVIRRCITYGDPWDALSSSGATALTAANGTIPAVTVSGLDRLVAVFLGCMDDQATGGAPSGFSSQVRATFTIGTDGQFWFLYKDDQFVSSSSIASALDAPVQGGYSFTGVSFKPANPNDGIATPSAIALSAVTAAPTASGQGVTTPAAIARTAVTPAPTVTGQGVALPTAIALTVVTPAPFVSGSGAGEAAPAAIQLTATVTTPSASGDANTAPAAATVSTTTPAPTASGGTGASTSPAATTLTATTPTPTVTGGATAFPAAIELVVVCPAPTAIGGTDAATTPTTIALDVTLSAPTAGGGATTTPPAVELAVVCATPFASGDQIFFPYWGARVG